MYVPQVRQALRADTFADRRNTTAPAPPSAITNSRLFNLAPTAIHVSPTASPRSDGISGSNHTSCKTGLQLLSMGSTCSGGAAASSLRPVTVRFCPCSGLRRHRAATKTVSVGMLGRQECSEASPSIFRPCRVRSIVFACQTKTHEGNVSGRATVWSTQHSTGTHLALKTKAKIAG